VWRTRPLDAVYSIVDFDAMVGKVREDRSVENRACYVALGVTCDGEREVLGICRQDSEGAKFWLAVLDDLRRRGVQDVLIACVDGLKGFPEAIEATFPQAGVQADLHRASHPRLAALRQLPRQEEGHHRAEADLHRSEQRRGPRRAQALRQRVGARYPATVQAWRASWEHVTPFRPCPTNCAARSARPNTIEALHRQIRKAIETRGHFPDEQAATKLIMLSHRRRLVSPPRPCRRP
jgi:putative transposase